MFLDFQETNFSKQSILWLLFPKDSSGIVFLSPLSRTELIESLNNNNFDELVNNRFLLLRKVLASNQKIRHENNVYSRLNRLSGFDRYMANKQRRRKRF